MEDQTTVNMQIDPANPWAARLGGSYKLISTTFENLREAVSVAVKGLQLHETSGGWPLNSSQVDFWRGLETFLWNDLLPLQTSSGAFNRSATQLDTISYRDAFIHTLSSAVTIDAAGVRINLPVPATGSVSLPQGALSWFMETAYPQEGSLAFTIFVDGELNFPLLIRPPGTGSAGGQLLRNGSTWAMVFDEGYLRLEGPWKNGDHIEFRFGIPFSIRAQGQKPVERGYPGAPALQGASVWHGCRQLVPLATEPAGSSVVGGRLDAAIAIGVRKDGVLIMRADGDDHGSPFEAPGDCFLTKDQPPQRLIAKSLIGSLPGISKNMRPTEVTFTAFETTFDRGA